MDEFTPSHLMANHGYHLLPRPHRSSPGYSGLLVAIRSEPTGEHFDPRTLRLRLRDSDGCARWRTLSWLTPTADSDHVCLGRIMLTDRLGKSLEFFTFGGSLKTVSRPGEYIYVLSSAAPILQLTETSETIPDQLAAETEALHARVESEGLSGEAGDGGDAAGRDPLGVYAGAVQSILSSCRHDRAIHQTYDALCAALVQEKMWLEGENLWPATP